MVSFSANNTRPNVNMFTDDEEIVLALYQLHLNHQVPENISVDLSPFGRLSIPLSHIDFRFARKGSKWKQERVVEVFAANLQFSLPQSLASLRKKILILLQDVIETTYYTNGQKSMDLQKLAGIQLVTYSFLFHTPFNDLI